LYYLLTLLSKDILNEPDLAQHLFEQILPTAQNCPYVFIGCLAPTFNKNSWEQLIT
jgi:hypothetical protein